MMDDDKDENAAYAGDDSRNNGVASPIMSNISKQQQTAMMGVSCLIIGDNRQTKKQWQTVFYSG